MNNSNNNEHKPALQQTPVSGWRDVDRITLLNRGDIVRSKATGKSYVVDANYGGHVTAVSTVDITNADEWEVLA